jgi:hypothetical protein
MHAVVVRVNVGTWRVRRGSCRRRSSPASHSLLDSSPDIGRVRKTKGSR